MLALGTGVACATFSLLLDGYLEGLFTGVFATTIVAMVGLLFLLVSGITFQVSGAVGESNTTDVLRAARRRKDILGWIDNVEIESGDVDHLVLTPAGILVIDTKWHSHGLGVPKLEADALASLASAARARNILRAVHHRPPAVTPIVVVWGGDQAQADGQWHLGVEFVSGQQLRGWLRARVKTGNSLNESQARALLSELESFKRRVRPAHRDPRVQNAREASRRQTTHPWRAGA